MSVFDDVNNTQVWSANDKTVRSLVGKGKCFPHPLVPISTVIPHLAFFFSATLHNRVILCPALSVSPRLEGSFYIPLAHSSECTTETMLSPEDPEKLAMIKPFNCIKSSLHFIQMLKKQKETWNWRKWHQELQPLIPRLREVRPVPEPAGAPSDQADSPCGSPGRKRMGRRSPSDSMTLCCHLCPPNLTHRERQSPYGTQTCRYPHVFWLHIFFCSGPKSSPPTLYTFSFMWSAMTGPTHVAALRMWSRGVWKVWITSELPHPQCISDHQGLATFPKQHTPINRQ